MMTAHETGTFELAPVSLWLEDLSGLRTLFAAWSKAGVPLRDYIRNDPGCLLQAATSIRILKVNRKTLSLYKTESMSHLIRNLFQIIGAQALQSMIEQMVGLWEGKREFFSTTVNHTLTGERLDIQVRGNILPGYERCWSRVLIAVEDVTELYVAHRKVAGAEAYARGLFENSPVSLCVKDFSAVRPLFRDLRGHGVENIGAHLKSDPGFAAQCRNAVRIVDVNRQALQLYGIRDPAADWHRHTGILSANLGADICQDVVGLWNGALFQERESVNVRLDGEQVHVQLQFSVLPGHEENWSLVQVARTDMTGRKKAEMRLRYLREHDSLTGLHSRAFFNEQMEHLGAPDAGPVTILLADLDGLKTVNDTLGHAEGDDMLRRVATVLSEVVTVPWTAARIGGDEFVIVMAGADEADGVKLMAAIQAGIARANHHRTDVSLSLSLGAATRHAQERLEATLNRADGHMYEAKRRYYRANRRDRRAGREDETPVTGT